MKASYKMLKSLNRVKKEYSDINLNIKFDGEDFFCIRKPTVFYHSCIITSDDRPGLKIVINHNGFVFVSNFIFTKL